MAILCFLKLAATIVSYASGNAGGIFAPSLYIGAMAGGAVGMLVHRIAPFPTGDPGAYALVGMGTLFAGIIRAPMTSVFMIFEITQDYQILVPLMVANLLSFMISQALSAGAGLSRAAAPGRRPSAHDGSTLRSAITRTARDVMVTDFQLVPPDMPLVEMSRFVAAHPAPAYLVGTPERLFGTATGDDIERWRAAGDGTTPVATLDPRFLRARTPRPSD